MFASEANILAKLLTYLKIAFPTQRPSPLSQVDIKKIYPKPTGHQMLEESSYTEHMELRNLGEVGGLFLP